MSAARQKDIGSQRDPNVVTEAVVLNFQRHNMSVVTCACGHSEADHSYRGDRPCGACGCKKLRNPTPRPSFPSAADARKHLGWVKFAANRYETAAKAQIAQAIFADARIDQRITVMQELLGSLGDLVHSAERIAEEYGLDLEDYMVMVRATADPDPSLFYPDALEEPDGVR